MLLIFLDTTITLSINWDRQACANNEDPDQLPQNAASDQGLHCLVLIRHILNISTGSRMDSFQILGEVW